MENKIKEILKILYVFILKTQTSINRLLNKKVYKDRRPLYIEFVGVPAVGKSTVYKRFFAQYKMQYLKYISFLNLNKRNIINPSNLDEFYQVLAKEKITSVLNNDFKGTEKLQVLSYFYNVIIYDYTISIKNKDDVVISEEGLIHNFGNEIKRLEKSNPQIINYIKLNRVIVYCYASPERIANQSLKRLKEIGRMVHQHKNKTLEELIEDQKHALAEKEDLINLLESYNIPVLRINTEDDINDNAKKIKAFIDELELKYKSKKK